MIILKQPRWWLFVLITIGQFSLVLALHRFLRPALPIHYNLLGQIVAFQSTDRLFIALLTSITGPLLWLILTTLPTTQLLEQQFHLYLPTIRQILTWLIIGWNFGTVINLFIVSPWLQQLLIGFTCAIWLLLSLDLGLFALLDPPTV